MYQTPQEAEAAFYEAFANADIEAMRGVWAEDDAVICIHPMGPRLEGRVAIEESWRAIFESSGKMELEIANAEYTEEAALSVHCVQERIRFGENLGQRSLVLATNAYRLTVDGWRMCLHHASPGRPGAVATTTAPPGALH